MWRLATKLVLTSLIALASATSAEKPVSQFTGIWDGTMNGQPGVEITLAPNDGNIGGTIIFYFQRLGADGKWHVEGDNRPQPLINPQMAGNTLSFEVLHHKKHESAELGPNKKFRLEVTGANEGRLREAGTQDDIPGHGLQLVRKPNRR